MGLILVTCVSIVLTNCAETRTAKEVRLNQLTFYYQVATGIEFLDNQWLDTQEVFREAKQYEVIDSIYDPIILKYLDSLKIRSTAFHRGIDLRNDTIIVDDLESINEYHLYLREFSKAEYNKPLTSVRARFFIDRYQKTKQPIYLMEYLNNITLLEYNVAQGLRFGLGGNKNCF